tara:strand:- start:255 stop:854 length:600 start_codon:yes stop_codon:yes gene_type:complete
MKKLFVMSLCIIIFSCFKTDIKQYETWNQDPATKASGSQINLIPRSYNAHSGKKFLSKYDKTMWADKENYFSSFSDIQFDKRGTRFYNADAHFISFFNIGEDISYCIGWKKGENSYDEKKWNIKFKNDEWDILWFDYEYYGTSQEIEYTITYKYEVIDGLLHFSSSDNQTFIFSPSDKNYSRGLIDTDEIIEQEGCLFF